MIFPKETNDFNLKTCDDAIADLGEPDESGLKELEGKNGSFWVGDHDKEGTELKSETEKLIKGQPAHTIRRTDNVGHPIYNRLLTVRETARLQSFPDSFRFFGSRQDRLNGIGNAVPVKTAEALGKEIVRMHKEIAKKESL